MEFVASTTAVNSPFYVAESVLDLVSVPSVSASVAVLTASVLDITSAAQPIFDVVTSESVLDVVSSAQLSAVAVIVSGSVLDFVPTSTQSPVGAVSSTSTLDLLSEVTVFPGVPAVGASVLDFNPSAIQTPIVAVTSQSVLDITSQGTITSFQPSGMTKNASAQNWSGSSTFQVTGMVAESGSTLSGSALLPNGSKTGATVTAQVSISVTNFMTSITAELRKNGTLVPGGTVTVSTSSTSTATLTIPTRTVDVVGTDQFTIWVTPGGATGGTVAAGVNTYVRIT